MTLSTKVAGSISIVVALGALVILFVALASQENALRREFRDTNVETLEVLALAVAPAVAEGRHERVQAALDNVANYPERFPDVVGLEVIDREGRVVADLDPTRFNVVLPPEDIAGDLALTRPETREEPGERLSVVVPLRLTHPLGVMRATLSEARLSASIREQQQNAAIAVLSSMAIIGIVLQLVLRRLVSRRLAALALAAARLGKGDMEVRAEAKSTDEIGQLGAAFNDMASELRRYTQELEARVSERTRDLERANEELARLATTDQLTGLYNRRHFEDGANRAIEVAWRSQRPFSLVLVDIDKFKSVNDRFGHPAGDEVLKRVATLLKDNARAADLVARIGGEEFAIAMPEATAELAAQAAERMRTRVQEAKYENLEGLGDEKITASFGVASFPNAGDRLHDLMLAADEALYASKESGRNRITISPIKR